MAKANRLPADRLRKKCHITEKTTEERAAQLQGYMPFCAKPSSLHNCTHQACATVAPACLRCGHIYIYHMHLNFRGTKLSEIADLHNIRKFYFHG